MYEATRGLVAGDAPVALRHARDIASLERSLHILVEGPVQHAAQAVLGLIGTLGFAYLTLHLSVTAGVALLAARPLSTHDPASRPLAEQSTDTEGRH